MPKVRDYEGLGYEIAAEAEDVLVSTDAEGFAETLRALLDTATDFGLRISTFEEAGVLTYDKGLVVSSDAGEFQVTIVKSG